MTQDQRNPALDGVRGIAVVLVLLWHMYYLAPRAAWTRDLPALDWISSQGWIGVHLFFVLSGFLLGRILLRHRGEPGYFSAFYIRRSARILPLYFLCLGSFWLFRAFASGATGTELAPLLDNRPLPFWSFPLFLQNVFMASGTMGCEWLTATWSLAVEEQFYLILPFTLARIPPKHVRTLAIATIGGAFALRVSSFLTTPGNLVAVSVLLPTRIDGFAFGVLAASLLESATTTTINRALGGFWAAGLAAYAGGGFLLPNTTGVSRALVSAMSDTSYYAIYTGLVVVAAVHGNHPIISRVLGNRPVAWLGQTSYFLYLFHLPVQYLVHWTIRGVRPRIDTPAGAACSCLTIALLLVSAELSRRFLERPLIQQGYQWGRWNTHP